MNDKAAEIINSNPVMVIATINEDGSPHITPVHTSFDGMSFFWKSSPDADHSRNIARDPRIAISVVDANSDKSRAVYVNTRAEATGVVTGRAEWPDNIAEYRADLTEFDEQKSDDDHYYFKEQA